MKKSTVMVICLLVVFLLGSAMGYRVGLRRALHKIGDEMVGDQLKSAQFAAECEARAYLYSLRALDSGRPEDIEGVRKRALAHLRVYVQGVHDLRDQGYDWTPVNGQTFSNAAAYLPEHPSHKSVK